MVNPKWLENAVIYQIYPQSFYDSNDDGIGDLNGIIQKLDYIKDLGVNVIWLNPIFESPFEDAGYDITDYYKVAPRYGTNEDFSNLCKAAHNKGIKVLCDLVPGHTSIQHPWFKASSKNERNEFSDRYIWTRSKDETGFRMNVREYERDGQYRCNYYAVQPSLNYGYAKITAPWQMKYDEKPCIETRDMICDVMAFWLDLGCDGFRVDMANCLIKNDNDCKYNILLWQYFRKWLDDHYPNTILMSEWGEPDRAIKGGFHIDMLVGGWHRLYTSLFRQYDENNKNFSYFSKDSNGNISDFLDSYMPLLKETIGKGYISIPTSSHDNHRISENRTVEELKVAYAFIFTMPGVPILYYGDELGMNYTPNIDKEGSKGRGGSRTPMQWDRNKKNYGFTNSDTPYLPLDYSNEGICVSSEEKDENSLYNFTKKIIALRKENPALLSDGIFNLLPTGYLYPFGYERICGNEKFHILLNPSSHEEVFFEENLIDNVLLDQNVKYEGNKITLSPISFTIYKVE